MRRTGFNLVELLVVVSILGILVALSIPHFMRAIERTRVQEAQETLRALFESERLYRMDNDRFTDLGTLVNERYAADPDPGNSITDWDFAIDPAGVGVNRFTAIATRTGGGQYNNQTVSLDQTFNGNTFTGNHDLRNQ